jgi:hypothetical protein
VRGRTPLRVPLENDFDLRRRPGQVDELPRDADLLARRVQRMGHELVRDELRAEIER